MKIMRILCNLTEQLKKDLDDCTGAGKQGAVLKKDGITGSWPSSKAMWFNSLLKQHNAVRLPDSELPDNYKPLKTMVVVEVANETDGDNLSIALYTHLKAECFYDTRYGEPSWAKDQSLGALPPPPPPKKGFNF
jgi:hypothetical protein